RRVRARPTESALEYDVDAGSRTTPKMAGQHEASTTQGTSGVGRPGLCPRGQQQNLLCDGSGAHRNIPGSVDVSDWMVARLGEYPSGDGCEESAIIDQWRLSSVHAA